MGQDVKIILEMTDRGGAQNDAIIGSEARMVYHPAECSVDQRKPKRLGGSLEILDRFQEQSVPISLSISEAKHIKI